MGTGTLDLITSLPQTEKGFDAIVVFVDMLTKMAHFWPCTTEVTGEGVAQLFLTMCLDCMDCLLC